MVQFLGVLMGNDTCHTPFCKALSEAGNFKCMAFKSSKRALSVEEATALAAGWNKAKDGELPYYVHFCLPGGLESGVPRSLGGTFDRIQHWSFKGTRLSVDAAAALKRASKGRKFITLNLEDCGLLLEHGRSKVQVALDVLESAKGVENLRLGCNRLNDAAAVSLAKCIISHADVLAGLSLENNHIRSGGFEALVKASGRCKRLASMSFEGNCVESCGVKRAVKVIENESTFMCSLNVDGQKVLKRDRVKSRTLNRLKGKMVFNAHASMFLPPYLGGKYVARGREAKVVEDSVVARVIAKCSSRVALVNMLLKSQWLPVLCAEDERMGRKRKSVSV